MSKQILILPGDGIGPEIMAEAVKVLELVNDKYSLGFELSFDELGGAAVDKYGVPLADETLVRARAADATVQGLIWLVSLPLPLHGGCARCGNAGKRLVSTDPFTLNLFLPQTSNP